MISYIIFLGIILGIIIINILEIKSLQKSWNIQLISGIFALCIMLFIWNISDPHPAFGDFTKAYYSAGKLILTQPNNLYIVGGHAGFVNIPIIAYLFSPFSVFNIKIAELVITSLGIIAVIATYYITVNLTKVQGWKKRILFWIFVINGPLYYSLKEGNTTHFVLLLLLWAVFCLQAKREIWAGILLALTALLKLPLLIFGLYLVVRRRWRASASFFGTLLVIIGSSIMLFGINLHLNWYDKCIAPYIGKPISRYNVQSVDSFLIRLLTSPELLNTGNLIEVDWKFKIIKYLLLGFILGICIWCAGRYKAHISPKIDNLEFSIVLCIALISSPISWTHYYLLLLLPLALYFSNRLPIPEGGIWFELMILSTLLISLPVLGIPTNNPLIKMLFLRLFISHYFLGLMLLMGIFITARLQMKNKIMLLKYRV